MMIMSNLRSILVAAALLSMCYLITATQDDPKQLYELNLAKQLLPSTRSTRTQVKRETSNEVNSSTSSVENQPKSALWPMVSVDRDANSSKVDVNIPIVFNMKKDENPSASKLDLSVLSGLVTINRDKARQANGTLTGPLKVTVLGIPVYSGRAVTRSRAENREPERENSPYDSPLESVLNQDILGNITKLNERLFDSVMEKLSETVKNIWLRVAPHTTEPGKPLKNSEKLVSTPKFQESDFKPVIPRDGSA